jgi:MFS family permease
VKLYYGWVLVVTLGITETISWGILYYAFTVYLGPMEAELGWSRGDMTGAYSIGLLLAGVAAIPVGRWLDKFGPRLMMTLGSIAGALLMVAWASVTDLTQFYLIWAAMGLCLSVTLYDPAFATVTKWFDRKRVRALTVVTLMAGFASTIFIPLAGYFVQTQGWRPSLLTLAAILAVGTIAPHALLLRRRPEDLGLEPDGLPRRQTRPETQPPTQRHSVPVGEAVRDASFRWLAAAFWMSALATTGVAVHLVPYLQDRGYELTFAASATGLIGAFQVLARLVMAPFGDRTSPRILAALTLALQPAALVLLLLAPGNVGLFGFVILFGASRGAATLTRPALLAGLYGAAQYASIAGVVQFAVSLAHASAPYAVGAAYDALTTYEPIFWVLTLVSVLAVLTVLPARARSPRPRHTPAEALQSDA